MNQKIEEYLKEPMKVLPPVFILIAFLVLISIVLVQVVWSIGKRHPPSTIEFRGTRVVLVEVHDEKAVVNELRGLGGMLIVGRYTGEPTKPTKVYYKCIVLRVKKNGTTIITRECGRDGEPTAYETRAYSLDRADAKRLAEDIKRYADRP